MKVSSISAIGSVARIIDSPVVSRLNQVRRGLREHGSVIMSDSKLDAEVISRLQRQFGKENVIIKRSTNIQVTVKNFNR